VSELFEGDSARVIDRLSRLYDPWRQVSYRRYSVSGKGASQARAFKELRCVTKLHATIAGSVIVSAFEALSMVAKE